MIGKERTEVMVVTTAGTVEESHRMATGIAVVEGIGVAALDGTARDAKNVDEVEITAEIVDDILEATVRIDR